MKPLTIIINLAVVVAAATAQTTVFAKDITVNPGDSLEKARDSAKAGDRILLKSGTYRLTETLVLGPENSGGIWMTAPGAKPVISGGAPDYAPIQIMAVFRAGADIFPIC